MIYCGRIDGELARTLSKGLHNCPGLKAEINGHNVSIRIEKLYNCNRFYATTSYDDEEMHGQIPKLTGNITRYGIEKDRFVLRIGFTKLYFDVTYNLPDDTDYSALDEKLFIEMAQTILMSKHERCNSDVGRYCYSRAINRLKDALDEIRD